MRAFALLAACQALSAVAQAEEVLSGRKLHSGNADESRSEYYTETISTRSDLSGDPEKFEGLYLVGLIVGFILTGLFMAFAIFWIVKDEIERHWFYLGKIEKDIKRLTNVYGWTDADVKRAADDFVEKERLRGQKDAAKEQEELAKIN